MNFLFWNIHKQALLNEIVELVEQEQTDVLMLAESGFPPIALLHALNEKKADFHFSPDLVCEKIQLFTKFRPKFSQSIFGDRRFTIRKLFSPKFGEVLLMILHFQSQVNWTTDDQAAFVPELKQAIDACECQVKHKRTIICGDFNMNPFENGMVQSTGFHAVMDRKIALKKSRTISGREYDFMYNPMWSFLGDMSRGDVAGTLYHSPAKPINYHWNMFDQVLMRPELIHCFDDNYLDIVTNIGAKSLLSQNDLVDKTYSDHLPIKFCFNI